MASAQLESYLPNAVVDALNKLATELALHNLRLNSVEILRCRVNPYVAEYVLATPGGTVKIKQEV